MPTRCPSPARSRTPMKFRRTQETHPDNGHDQRSDIQSPACPIGRTRSDPELCSAPPAQPREEYSAKCRTRLGCRAEKVRPALHGLLIPGKPSRSPEQLLWLMQHQRRWSFLLLEYSLENDFLKALNRGGSAFDLHAENGPLPGSQEEFSQIHRIER